ncbi:MAG: crotonase/enoyl-CoA hydratase family protein [Desulfosarcinaceae bacterium]|nr:crotonase/enoyl-CoA hydratase family protein [Desulfosarcinaceae bacterium]
MTTDTHFRLEREGPVARLVLNRPDQRNAMDMVFFERLAAHFNALDADPEIRAVVLNAAGKSFTTGMDLAAAGGLLSNTGADGREALRRKIVQFQSAVDTIEKCRKPVIAAVHSHCIGGGVDLLCACDIRLASADALFSIRETRMAIIADLGTLQRLPLIIGQGWFRELAFTGRDFGAAEALQMGFVTRILSDRERLQSAAMDLAREIAALPPLTVQGVKEVANFSRDHGTLAGRRYVAQKNAAALISEDLMEAVGAFMEKRSPDFKGK